MPAVTAAGVPGSHGKPVDPELIASDIASPVAQTLNLPALR
jgi:hypothetical protein